jgi:hypothetical protein
MSDDEKYKAQGKTHADLKKARSNVATLSSSLNGYARDFQSAGRTLSDFVANPRLNLQLLPENAKRAIGVLPPLDQIAAQIDELVEETRLVERLQEEVDRF